MFMMLIELQKSLYWNPDRETQLTNAERGRIHTIAKYELVHLLEIFTRDGDIKIQRWVSHP